MQSKYTQLPLDLLPMKRCTRCGELKPLDAFRPRKNRPAGHEGCCKVCRLQPVDPEGYHRAKAERAANRAAGVKRCTQCGDTKPVAEFQRDKTRHDGYASRCKVCACAIDNARHLANRAIRNAARREAYQHDPEHRERMLARRAINRQQENARSRLLYQTRHRERNIASASAYNKAHRAQIRESERIRREANPLKHRAFNHKYRVLRKGATLVHFTTAQLQAKMDYWGNRCWMCGGQADTIDHVKPLTKGGAHALCNLRPACRSCNSTKWNRWPYPLVRNIPRWQ